MEALVEGKKVTIDNDGRKGQTQPVNATSKGLVKLLRKDERNKNINQNKKSRVPKSQDEKSCKV